MKPFNGPKRQRGWIGIAAMVVGGIASSTSSQSAANKQNKVKYSDSRDLSNLQFEQQSWLSQQQEKWSREDTAKTEDFKQNTIRSFADAAPANTASADGSWGAPPPLWQADTQGLAQTDANGNPLIYDPRTGAPSFANAQVPQAPVAPAKTVPMGQFG